MKTVSKSNQEAQVKYKCYIKLFTGLDKNSYLFTLSSVNFCWEKVFKNIDRAYTAQVV
jgi:hypothetical protein